MAGNTMKSCAKDQFREMTDCDWLISTILADLLLLIEHLDKPRSQDMMK